MAFSPHLIGSVLAVPVVAVFDKVTYQKARSEAILSGTVVAPERKDCSQQCLQALLFRPPGSGKLMNIPGLRGRDAVAFTGLFQYSQES